MITIFTTALPFKGAAAQRQLNAIRSWKAAFPGAEIILFGRGEGYEEASVEEGLRRFPDVLCNKNGLPRIDSIFEEGERLASHQYRAYINADIIVTTATRKALLALHFPKFLMVARRWNLEVEGILDVSKDDWDIRLWEKAREYGNLARGDAIDIFVWRDKVWDSLLPMVIGRAKFDNWLIYSCRSRGIPVIDASEIGSVIHQRHVYDHVPGGAAGAVEGEDGVENARLAGGWDHLFTIDDADWRLTKGRLVRNFCAGDSRRCAEVHQILRNRAPRRSIALEAWYEFLIRLQKAWHGEPAPALKFLPWLGSRLIGKR